MDFMSKFRSNPLAPGMNYEKINDAYDKNMRSVRIDDTYRAIVMRDEMYSYSCGWITMTRHMIGRAESAAY